MAQDKITSILKEQRVFEPSKEFSAAAHIGSFEEYERLYRSALDDPDSYWANCAREIDWFEPWQKVLQWDYPYAKWFVGAKLNASYNCLDRHLKTWRKNKAAIIWEGEPGDSRTLTYHQLYQEVCRFANSLKTLGVVAGDRVAIYMPLVPELAIAVLACARIGAIHTVIFAGFAAHAIRDRVNDAQAKVVVTSDGGYRRGQELPLKPNVDEALKECPSVRNVVVLRRTGSHFTTMHHGRDYWWHDLVSEATTECEPEHLDSEHPLFTLYTSGTTGKPKGILHTTGGYLVGVAVTSKLVFDLKETDTFWCTADIGWITGHSYVVYGPLANGATVVMYEGAPNWPQPDRFWQIVDKFGVSILYTAPTAIRAFMKWGDEWPERHSLSSLRLLGTVGEPINPEAWIWYHRVIGKQRCPIVDTWWQTETGAIMISPLPGATPTTPGSATRPLPGIVLDIVDKNATSLPDNTGGFLVIRRPWPSMLRTVYGDDERYRRQYWGEIDGVYFTGDGARRDERGYYWIMGRVDDVINVSGHRLSTMEIESALVSHQRVAEAAVVARPDALKGQAIVAFVTLASGVKGTDELKQDLKEHVSKEIGALARPEEIRFTEALPKTRSGKIMRRLLRDVACGNEALGDTTTLEDISVLARLRDDEE